MGKLRRHQRRESAVFGSIVFDEKLWALFVYHPTVAPHRRRGVMRHCAAVRPSVLRLNVTAWTWPDRLIHCPEVHITT